MMVNGYEYVRYTFIMMTFDKLAMSNWTELSYHSQHILQINVQKFIEKLHESTKLYSKVCEMQKKRLHIWCFHIFPGNLH